MSDTKTYYPVDSIAIARDVNAALEPASSGNSGLLPCPFCGSPAMHDADEDHHGEFHTLGCSDKECAAWWMFYTIGADEVADAIKKWNRRAR